MNADIRPIILRALEIVRDSITPTQYAAIVESANVDLLFQKALSEAVLERAMLPLRFKIRSTAERAFRYTLPDLPRGGKVNGVIAVAFDHLSPHVVTAIRTLEDGALSALKTEIRQTVRDTVERGIKAGKSPIAIGREIRDVIGLAPTHAEQVANYRAALEAGDLTKVKGYTLRPKRYDDILARGELTPAQIDRAVEAYRESRLAQNAVTNAKTITFNAYKQGQQLAWQDAKAKGVVPPGFQPMKTWKHFDPQPDPRPEHQAMNGETVPLDQPYSNGDSYAGEGDPWNCKCLDKIALQRSA